jgi:hypothetical protein
LQTKAIRRGVEDSLKAIAVLAAPTLSPPLTPDLGANEEALPPPPVLANQPTLELGDFVVTEEVEKTSKRAGLFRTKTFWVWLQRYSRTENCECGAGKRLLHALEHAIVDEAGEGQRMNEFEKDVRDCIQKYVPKNAAIHCTIQTGHFVEFKSNTLHELWRSELIDAVNTAAIVATAEAEKAAVMAWECAERERMARELRERRERERREREEEEQREAATRIQAIMRGREQRMRKKRAAEEAARLAKEKAERLAEEERLRLEEEERRRLAEERLANSESAIAARKAAALKAKLEALAKAAGSAVAAAEAANNGVSTWP